MGYITDGIMCQHDTRTYSLTLRGLGSLGLRGFRGFLPPVSRAGSGFRSGGPRPASSRTMTSSSSIKEARSLPAMAKESGPGDQRTRTRVFPRFFTFGDRSRYGEGVNYICALIRIELCCAICGPRGRWGGMEGSPLRSLTSPNAEVPGFHYKAVNLPITRVFRLKIIRAEGRRARLGLTWLC
jgi:hypothetical protein